MTVNRNIKNVSSNQPVGPRRLFQILLGGMIFMVAGLGGNLVALASPNGPQSKLRTQDFIVTITINCPEGNVSCDDVSYDGVNIHTNESVQLQGRTRHTRCADGISPCRLIGYEFFNGDFRYFVETTGDLSVFRGEKLLLQQPGQWE